MKNIFFVIILLITASGFSQNLNRIQVNGKVIVESADVSGITVFNKTLNVGTITNENGEFTLDVKLNNIIEVSGVQYKNITFSVNEDIIESKSIKVFLIHEINELDEVVVFSKGLTGNLNADLEARTPYKLKLDVLYFGIKNKNEFEFEIDNTTKVNSVAMDAQHLPAMVNGLNIKNIVDQLLLPLFRSGVKNKKKAGVPEVPAHSIKYYLGSEFLVDNFNIPEHRVEAFVRYVSDEAFDYNLLNYGKEMELLQLLSDRSVEFLNQ